VRILFLTHRLPYAPNRGDRIRAYYLLREMSRFAEVSLFSLVHDDEEWSQCGNVPFASDVTCRRVHRLPNLARAAARLATARPLTHSLLDAGGVHRTLQALIDRRSPDLVVAFCSGMVRFALEPPLEGRRFVLDMVDVDSVKWDQLANVSRAPLRWIYRREARTLRTVEAAAAARASATLVVNERERVALEKIAPNARVVVVPAGIELDAFRPPHPPTGAPAVIFCGVMNYRPNEQGVLWFASEVWPRVRSFVPNATFTVVGSSPTRAVKHLAVRDPSIVVVGQVPAVQPYLWQAAVSVAPIHLAQGIQTKVLEALAAGLPVVLTPAVSRGLPPAVQRLCPIASDPEPFARAVVDLLRCSPDDRRRKAASAPLETLRWSEQLRDLEGILRQGLPETSSIGTHRPQAFSHS
jgi:sugar transferase (PEP-CTERM/EpsH1 system associated)